MYFHMGMEHFRLREEVLYKVYTGTPEETASIAEEMGEACRVGCVFALSGDLGAGKTLFTKGLARGLGVKDAVTSPTFTLLNVYEGRLELFHFDLYRLENEDELEGIGFYEYAPSPDGVTVIEWADKFPAALPDEHIAVNITASDDKGGRWLSFSAVGDDAGEWLEGFFDAGTCD